MKKIVVLLVVFGTFDIIHPAHLRFLVEARTAANCPYCELIVVLARDSSINRIKGHPPIFDEEKRLKLISGLRVVDYAQLGNEGENPFQIKTPDDTPRSKQNKVHQSEAIVSFLVTN